MKTTRWALASILLLAVLAPSFAQDDREPPRGDGGDGWGDGNDGRNPRGPDDRNPQRGPDGGHREGGNGRDGQPPHPPQPPMPPRELSEDEVNQTLEWLKGWDKFRAHDLESKHEQNPHEFMRGIQEAYFEMKRMSELEKSNPEAFAEMKREREMEMRSFDLAQQIRKSTDDAEKEKLKAELMPLLGQLFDIREKHKDQEIDRLSQELKRLQEQVEKRRKNKDAIVEKRFNELTGEANDEGW